ncbi:MAG TPA: hypothetical protein VFK41_08235 [Nocardioidaceae bacterium]|nr:hypothetical protein [Nocardioidaceae bacterium]
MTAPPPGPPTAEGTPVDPVPAVTPDSPEPGEMSGEMPSRLALAAQDGGRVLGVFAALGVLCGVVWLLLVEPAQVVRVEGNVLQSEIELTRMFAYDGWYAAIAAPVGLLAGLLLSNWRSRDPLVTLLFVVAGCCLAAVLMLGTGYLLGPADPAVVLAEAPIGATADVQMKVSGVATYLAWPLPTLLGSLISLLSRTD